MNSKSMGFQTPIKSESKSEAKSKRQNLSKLMRSNIKLKRREMEQQQEDIGYGDLEMFEKTDFMDQTVEEDPEPEAIIED